MLGRNSNAKAVVSTILHVNVLQNTVPNYLALNGKLLCVFNRDSDLTGAINIKISNVAERNQRSHQNDCNAKVRHVHHESREALELASHKARM